MASLCASLSFALAFLCCCFAASALTVECPAHINEPLHHTVEYHNFLPAGIHLPVRRGRQISCSVFDFWDPVLEQPTATLRLVNQVANIILLVEADPLRPGFYFFRIPPDTAVGTHTFVVTPSDGSAHSFEVTVLFDPFSPADDQVFLQHDDHRRWFVEQSTGCIWGLNLECHVVQYDQYEILWRVLEFQGIRGFNGSPHVEEYVDFWAVNARVAEDALPHEQLQFMEASWDPQYYLNRGVQPWHWSHARDFFIQYFDNHHRPLQYGQCFTFAFLLTAVFRSLGIPAREITNYESCKPHFFHVVQNADDKWPFHVWNEVWMRPHGRERGVYAVDGTVGYSPTPVSAILNNQFDVDDADYMIDTVKAPRFNPGFLGTWYDPGLHHPPRLNDPNWTFGVCAVEMRANLQVEVNALYPHGPQALDMAITNPKDQYVQFGVGLGDRWGVTFAELGAYISSSNASKRFRRKWYRDSAPLSARKARATPKPPIRVAVVPAFPIAGQAIKLSLIHDTSSGFALNKSLRFVKVWLISTTYKGDPLAVVKTVVHPVTASLDNIEMSLAPKEYMRSLGVSPNYAVFFTFFDRKESELQEKAVFPTLGKIAPVVSRSKRPHSQRSRNSASHQKGSETHPHSPSSGFFDVWSHFFIQSPAINVLPYSPSVSRESYRHLAETYLKELASHDEPKTQHSKGDKKVTSAFEKEVLAVLKGLPGLSPSNVIPSVPVNTSIPYVAVFLNPFDTALTKVTMTATLAGKNGMHFPKVPDRIEPGGMVFEVLPPVVLDHRQRKGAAQITTVTLQCNELSFALGQAAAAIS